MEEQVADGSRTTPSLDAPPEAQHAGTFTPAEEDFIEGLINEPEGEPEGEPEPEPELEPEPEPQPEPQPKTEDKSAEGLQMLDWILKNPAEFAKRAGLKVEETVRPQEESLESLYQLPKPIKPVEEMQDTELFEYAVGKKVHEVFSKIMPKLTQELSLVKEFKANFENVVMKSALSQDGKLLHPRWDELQPQIRDNQGRFPGMSPAEAYVLADRMVPSAIIAGEPEPRPAPRLVESPKPRKASPQAAKAAMLTSLGRSSQAVGGASPKSLREAVERAINETGLVRE